MRAINSDEAASDESESPNKLVGALTSGLSILRYLSQAEAPVGVSQVARDLGINTSTCFNLLKTLAYEKLVTFHPASKTYTLGLGFVELAKQTLDKASFARMIRPHLDALVARYSVTTTLWQRIGDDRVILVDRADCDSALRVYMTIGQRLPLYIGALGRVMAAYSGLSRADLRQRFNQLRWQNSPSFDEYYAEVEEAAERGYAVDVDHYVSGVTTISAPIFSGEASPSMALSAIGFSGQFTGSVIEDIGADLRDRARSVSAALTGSSALPPVLVERMAS